MPMTIEEMKSVDVRTVPKDQLVDMREQVLPDTDDVDEMLAYILNKKINWYVHRRGNIVVENEYMPGKTINDIFGIMVASS